MSREIAFASDHAGVQLKAALVAYARELGYETVDLGTDGAASVDYPDYAAKCAAWVLRGEVSKPSEPSACEAPPHASDSASHSGGIKNARIGVLICGSGIGMSMAANRVRGIRAALVRAPEEAALSRQHNNANVLCLGERITPQTQAKECLARFLETPFEGGRHAGRVEKMG